MTDQAEKGQAERGLFQSLPLSRPAAPAGAINAEVFDAIGTMAERLAWRANVSATNAANAPVRPGEPGIAAQLQVASDLGVHFDSLERDGHVWLCYDGDAFRHALALSPTPEQSARLTEFACYADGKRSLSGVASTR